MYLSCCGCISGRFPFRQIYIFRLKHCCRNNREIVKLFSNFYFRSLYVLFLVVRFCFVLYVVLCFFLVLLSWLLVFLSCSSVCFFFLILLSSSSFLFFCLLLLSYCVRAWFFRWWDGLADLLQSGLLLRTAGSVSLPECRHVGAQGL